MSNATIYDVAGQARVSLATVSRVLNNPEKVNEETRKRVLAVIKELGYRPNAIAKGLASRKTTTVGVIVSDITRASVSQMLGGIMDIARQYDYSIKIFSMINERDMDDFARKVVSEQVDGIIFLNDELEHKQIAVLEEYFNDSEIPVILANTVFEDYDVPTINIDFKKASYEITKEMINRGKKDIYLFSTVRRYAVNTLKESGYIEAMEEAGLEPRVFRTSGDPDINTLHFKEFFSMHKIDGALAVRDSIAVSFINVASLEGKKIGEDILVVGFQNTKYAKLSRPTLTCIDMPVYDLGAYSMKQLTKFMKKEEIKDKDIVLDYKLVYRESMPKI